MQYRKLTAGYPVPHSKTLWEISCCKLFHLRKLSARCPSPRAEQCKLHLTPLTPRKERGTCCASARAHPRKWALLSSMSHSSSTASFLSLLAGSALQQAEMEGQEGHGFKSKEPREEPTALDCCQGKSCWGGRRMEGTASKPKWEQRTSLRPKDTEISC